MDVPDIHSWRSSKSRQRRRAANRLVEARAVTPISRWQTFIDSRRVRIFLRSLSGGSGLVRDRNCDGDTVGAPRGAEVGSTATAVSIAGKAMSLCRILATLACLFMLPMHHYVYLPGCGLSNEESRIVGGQTTQMNEYPWMARLSYFNRFYCGGMLINDRYVLTAAHCVKGFMWFMIKVSFGEHDRCNSTLKPESRFVIRAFAGEFSFTNFDNDIALLRLNDRVPVAENIRPICLPKNTSMGESDYSQGLSVGWATASLHIDIFIDVMVVCLVAENYYKGSKAVAAGWGTLQEDGKPSCLLQDVEVPVLSNEECRNSSRYLPSMISDNMLCAGFLTGKKDSCQGDSGGPLFIQRTDKKYELIGVVSWGNGCARVGYPGIYTRVTRYLDWIIEHSRDGCFCDDD
uniref:(California timema) hypothetical protein n=1 Tax=Timema californicum TaxID=61474 RepID=A0A7R9JCY4_TIMCA|nr:unnamed protein product [Timema californicum]